MAKIKDQTQVHPWTDPDHCFVVGAHAFVLKVTSFFGMAPLRFKPHNNGYIVSLSIPMCIFSYILVTVSVSIEMFGIISELNLSTSPFRQNSSYLSKVISLSDFIFLALLGSAAVYGAPSRMKNMIRFMGNIALIDKIIRLKYSNTKERRWCTGFIFIMFIFTLILINDICLEILYASPDKKWDLLKNDLGFYLLLYLALILELQFAFTAIMVHDRFKTLNQVLSRTTHHLSMPNITNGPSLLLSPTDCVHQNALLYNKLCDVVRDLENSYDFSLIVILVSTMFHLITTLYFTAVDMDMRAPDNWYQLLTLDVIWCGLHLFRVFMAVEPCHYTTCEGNKTKRLVCYMMMASPTKGALAFQLKLFYRQLMLRPVCYKPLGICFGRPLLASMFGAVTTFLVILIQFQK